MNIEINNKMYGTNSSNVTLIWMPPVVAKRLAHYRIELMSSETTSKELIVNTTEVNIKDTPYNQETTVSISAVNDCSGEGMKQNFSFIICKYFLFKTLYIKHNHDHYTSCIYLIVM